MEPWKQTAAMLLIVLVIEECNSFAEVCKQTQAEKEAEVFNNFGELVSALTAFGGAILKIAAGKLANHDQHLDDCIEAIFARVSEEFELLHEHIEETENREVLRDEDSKLQTVFKACHVIEDVFHDYNRTKTDWDRSRLQDACRINDPITSMGLFRDRTPRLFGIIKDRTYNSESDYDALGGEYLIEDGRCVAVAHICQEYANISLSDRNVQNKTIEEKYQDAIVHFHAKRLELQNDFQSQAKKDVRKLLSVNEDMDTSELLATIRQFLEEKYRHRNWLLVMQRIVRPDLNHVQKRFHYGTNNYFHFPTSLDRHLFVYSTHKHANCTDHLAVKKVFIEQPIAESGIEVARVSKNRKLYSTALVVYGMPLLELYLAPGSSLSEVAMQMRRIINDTHKSFFDKDHAVIVLRVEDSNIHEKLKEHDRYHYFDCWTDPYVCVLIAWC